MAGPPNERHQPLPGVLQIPGFLYRKLSRRGRRLVKIGAGLATVAVVALAIVLVPRIQESKEEGAARERREAAENLAERRRRLISAQRPHTGTTGGSGVKAALPSAIEADARRRAQAGELDNPPKRVECVPLDDVRRRGGSLSSYSCTAVTSDIPATAGSEGGTIGYPYRALADPREGSFTFCRVAGRPGEGSYTREAVVELPRDCG